MAEKNNVKKSEPTRAAIVTKDGNKTKYQCGKNAGKEKPADKKETSKQEAN